VLCRFDEDFPNWSKDHFDLGPFSKKWFGAGDALDHDIKEKFGKDVEAIGAGQYDDWLSSSLVEGLAGIILMDQFTRNMYRRTPQMCASKHIGMPPCSRPVWLKLTPDMPAPALES
jgi:uncharacterized protein (DUF924 family)